MSQDISVSNFIFLDFCSVTADLKQENYSTAQNPSCCQLKEYTGSPENWTFTSAFPTVSALTHPEHRQPFSARPWIWV